MHDWVCHSNKLSTTSLVFIDLLPHAEKSTLINFSRQSSKLRFIFHKIKFVQHRSHLPRDKLSTGENISNLDIFEESERWVDIGEMTVIFLNWAKNIEFLLFLNFFLLISHSGGYIQSFHCFGYEAKLKRDKNALRKSIFWTSCWIKRKKKGILKTLYMLLNHSNLILETTHRLCSVSYTVVFFYYAHIYGLAFYVSWNTSELGHDVKSHLFIKEHYLKCWFVLTCRWSTV